jgi:hypothetical protein
MPSINGTPGNDTLNGTGGDDIINGLAGNDTLTGGFGWDVFKFDLSSGNDTIMDYSPGEDWLDLSAYGFTSFAQIMSHANQVGTNVVINLTATDSVTLQGIQLDWLRPADFVGVTMIPPYGSPPGPVNMTAPEYINTPSGNVFTLNSGEYRFATQLNALWFDTSLSGTFNNNGTIWWDPNFASSWTFTVINTDTVNNAGKIVILTHSADQDIWALRFNNPDNSFQNSGQIFALASSGDARVISADGPMMSVTNSGLLAARADDGLATTIFMRYGGILNNQSGGQILAEGLVPIAVDLQDARFNTQINNAGLIEANSLVPAIVSMGIRIGNLEGQAVQVTNSGTIRADDAIYADDLYAASTPQMSVQNILNQNGGLIDGDIILGRGSDSVTNSGAIIGDLVMGEGTALR